MCESCKNLWMVHQGKKIKGDDTLTLYTILLKYMYDKHIKSLLDVLK